MTDTSKDTQTMQTIQIPDMDTPATVDQAGEGTGDLQGDLDGMILKFVASLSSSHREAASPPDVQTMPPDPVRVARDAQALAAEGKLEEAARLCDEAIAAHPDAMWPLHMVRADLSLRLADVAGFEAHLQEAIAPLAKESEKAGVWVGLLFAFHFRRQNTDELRVQLDRFCASFPNLRDAVFPLYVILYLQEGDFEAAYAEIRRIVKESKGMVVFADRQMAEAWPFLLVELGKWNECAEVRRFVKRYAGRAGEDKRERLSRFYLQRTQIAWSSGEERATRFFLDLAGTVAPPGSDVIREIHAWRDILAEYEELVRAAQDQRVPLPLRARMLVWYADRRPESVSAEYHDLLSLLEPFIEEPFGNPAMVAEEVSRIRSRYPHLHALFADQMSALVAGQDG